MNVAPGWYPDSLGVVRYWDGAQWTAHTQAPQAPQAQQLQQAPQTPQVVQPEYAPRPEQTPASTELQAMPQYGAPEQVHYAQPQYAQPQYAQPQYGQPQYQQQVVGSGASNGLAVAGFVVGLVSIFLPLIFGLGAGAAGLVLSIMGAAKSGTTGTGKGLAVAGIILSSVGIVFIL